jgi:uncharacterized protein DUF4349/putative zinc finger protein
MNTSTHPVAPEEVLAFLDGELSADRSLSISAHLEQCVECGDLATSLRKVSQSLAGWAVSATPSQLEDRIITLSTKAHSPLSVAANGRVLSRRRWGWKRWTLTLATAGCAFLLLLAISIPHLLRSKMAANEASSSARQRSAETEKAISADFAQPVVSSKSDLEMSGHRGEMGAALGGVPRDSAKFVHRVPFAAPSGSPQAETPQLPMIAHTVSLSIVVKDFDAGRASLDAILARHNGYAASLNVSTPQGSARTLQASLRIPTPQLVSALSKLKALGRVENENQNGEEVTQQHADLVARLKNSRETEQRLQDVLRTRTGKVKDVLEVEEEIARVRGEIEQMEAEQKTLEHRVEFATIDLKLAEEYKAQLNTPAPSVLMQLRNAAVNGFRNAFESLLALVLFLAESGPSLLLWLALLGIPAWRLWRRYRRAQSLGSFAGA